MTNKLTSILICGIAMMMAACSGSSNGKPMSGTKLAKYNETVTKIQTIENLLVDINGMEASDALIKEINTQLRRIEAAKAAAAQAEWEFKMKQYEDEMELKRQKQEGWNALANRFGRIDIGYKRERAFKFGSSSK